MEEKKDCCILPNKPKEPLPEDCCGSGCSYCVYDVYQIELKKWEFECKRLLSGGKPSAEKQLLSQLDFKTFLLIGIYPSARSINIYRFAIPDSSRINIKPGQHLMMKGFNSEDKDARVCLTEKDDSPKFELNYITRPYTVLNTEEDHFDVMIKLYNNGQMSKYIRKLKVGEEVLWRGPFGDFCHNPSYFGNVTRTLLAFCAGTGIAPLYGISKSIVSDEDDETRIRILWANHSWDDMPLKGEMKELTSYWNLSCKLFFSGGLSSVPVGAKTFYELNDGRVNFDAVKMELDSLVDTEIQVLLCGTKSFEGDMMDYLNTLGVRNSSYHKFT
ncbi:hypothetical protein J437_LFUL001395 [Ladona fulva]|uniref:FAD-binding FR-type domain-containing protein n=1 Tax=Ladona fulva TaxID=123851 RepID=A0A8K0JYS8_LADFU|nr:hypothetical protein J437_LFUL001395 [Ladona fulva]